MNETIASAIRAALLTAEPRAKALAARKVARDWGLGRLAWAFDVPMPPRPARPDRPELLAPARMPKRGRAGSERGRIALWHALAHIEFVAIDLALDMAGRFGGQMDHEHGRQFVADFLAVAADEASHFALIERKLRTLGSGYGELPAHDGLWQAAEATAHDVKARLAVVPLVLEARGLDVTPAMLERVSSSGDAAGARLLQRILDDEIRHVAIGEKHFSAVCSGDAERPQDQWKALVKRYFGGAVKPPFNDSARAAGGLSRYPYRELAS